MMGFIQNELKKLMSIFLIQDGRDTGTIDLTASTSDSGDLVLKVFHIANNLLSYLNNQSGKRCDVCTKTSQ